MTFENKYVGSLSEPGKLFINRELSIDIREVSIRGFSCTTIPTVRKNGNRYEGKMNLTVTLFVDVCICGLCLDEKEMS